jgi:hypothetical protein
MKKSMLLLSGFTIVFAAKVNFQEPFVYPEAKLMPLASLEKAATT